MSKDASAEGQDQGGHWAFKPEGKQDAQAEDGQVSETSQGSTDRSAKGGGTEEVTWTASEYIAHHKGFGWYGLVFVGSGALAALIYLFSRDVISTGVIVVVAIIFVVAAARKPRVLTYRLDDSGLTIGNKFYAYGTFKSFALIEQGAFHNITFMPLKRFMPSLSIYFAPEDEQKIVDALSKYLPMEQSQGELVDRLMHRIRF